MSRKRLGISVIWRTVFPMNGCETTRKKSAESKVRVWAILCREPELKRESLRSDPSDKR